MIYLTAKAEEILRELIADHGRHVFRNTRGPVRLGLGEDVDIALEAAANMAADPERFAEVPDEWFWVDEFWIPRRKPWWSKENAPEVLACYEKIERKTRKTPCL